MYPHEEARHLMAQLHLLQNDSDEADKVRNRLEQLDKDMTDEERLEVELLSCLLHGPVRACKGSDAPQQCPHTRVEECPFCKEEMPVSNGKLSPHGIPSPHEAGFLWRCLRSIGADRRVPIPMTLYCPRCDGRHIDSHGWEMRRHATHACQHCGHVWRPAIEPTVGVQFLPGFRNDVENTTPKEPTVVWFPIKHDVHALWVNGQLRGMLVIGDDDGEFTRSDGVRHQVPDAMLRMAQAGIYEWATALAADPPHCSGT